MVAVCIRTYGYRVAYSYLIFIVYISGHKGIVFCLDGAPDFLYALLTMTISFQNDSQLQNNLICHTIDTVAPNNDVTRTLIDKLNEIESYEERIDLAMKNCPVQAKYSPPFVASMAVVTFDRLKAVLDFNIKNFKKLQAPVILLRPKENPPFVVVEENYGLDKLTDGPVTVHFLEGNHISILENKDCANIINRTVIQAQKGEIAPKTDDNVVTNLVETQRTVKVE